MSNRNDIDARFAELVAQFGERDMRRFRRLAAAGRNPRRPGRLAHRRHRVWLATWLAITLAATAGIVLLFGPQPSRGSLMNTPSTSASSTR